MKTKKVHISDELAPARSARLTGDSSAPAAPGYSFFHVAARRWFDRINGNTYHSVTIYADGGEIAREPFTYGYGDQYQETAAQLLAALPQFQALNDLARMSYPSSGANEPLWQWMSRIGTAISIDCVDVNRKKDL